MILPCLFLVLAGPLLAQDSFDFGELSRMIRSGSVEEKRQALFEIRNLECEECSRLAVPALADQSEIVRATAVSSVIFLPQTEAVQFLTPLLLDESPFVRSETAYALGKIGPGVPSGSLIEILEKDKFPEARSAAAVALGKIGDPKAIPGLTAVLRKKPKSGEEFLRRASARSIGQIARLLQTGKLQTTTPRDFLPEKFHKREQPKYRDLIESFPVFSSALDALINSLKNPKEFPDVKREAAFALGELGQKAAVPALTEALRAKDYYLGRIAENALAKINRD
ncbi:MAG: HEAT repeat domain-containing protein [Pyrinomonadaceae bacterium]